ncbi:4-coumarate--CoA ligase 1 isoform X3 [Apis mellifera]|nr:4-coumarate--CoA ligase 1 isoform X3 [Apis mellifera]|eukprot:XP_016768747.1 4-coumarate--CoA ligase 1 isoform X3 [Apis mellifera]
MFTIENNVLKGRVISNDNGYTSVGKLIFDTFRSKPNFVWQVDAISGIEDNFSDICDRTIKCALWMQKHGVKKGDIVAICSHNHRDCIIPFLATLYLGAIVNPWDHLMNIDMARHFITLSQPKVIFVNEGSAEIALEAAKIELHHTKLVCFGYYPGIIPFSETLKYHDKSTVANFQCTDIDDPLHTGLIMFSSGTTGMPKGVQLSHKSILNIMELREGFPYGIQTQLWFTPLYWISGSFLNLKSIYFHIKKISAPEFNEKIACEIIEKYKVDWIMLSTSMANRFVRYDYLHDYDISNLKFAIIGGSALNRETQDIIKKYLSNTMIIQAYGMTELGGIITIQSSTATSGSCGIVIPNCQIKIIDIETGKTLGPNQTGELCAKTWTMMTGYHKNCEATKNIFDKNGWLHSGDLAYYNENGEVFIVDRLKEIIKYKGYQISPNKIENLLQSHPAVLEVGVVGIPHPIYDELPIAFISKVPNKEVSEEELSKMVASNMMDIYKLRGGIKFLPSLPHTPSGKISRKKLRAMAKELIIN